jgi:hypothetical protein
VTVISTISSAKKTLRTYPGCTVMSLNPLPRPGLLIESQIYGYAYCEAIRAILKPPKGRPVLPPRYPGRPHDSDSNS